MDQLEFFQGYTEAEIKNLLENVHQIRDELKEIRLLMGQFSAWKNKVIGVSLVLSTLVTTGINLLIKFL